MARRRRFTRWREDRRVINPKLLNRDDKGNFAGPAADQLAAYEDTELTPAQVVQLQKTAQLLQTEVAILEEQVQALETELHITQSEREYFRSQSRFFREMSGNLPKMITVEGYKLFRGTVMVKPVGTEQVSYVSGDWLYKPFTKCWYCKGSSYPEDCCRILEVE